MRTSNCFVRLTLYVRGHHSALSSPSWRAAARRRADCERMRTSASAGIDGEISEFETLEIKRHLIGCTGCRESTRRIEGVSRLLRREPLESVDIVPARYGRRGPGRREVSAAIAICAATACAVSWAYAIRVPSLRTAHHALVDARRPAYLDSSDYEQTLIAAAKVQRLTRSSAVRPQ